MENASCDTGDSVGNKSNQEYQAKEEEIVFPTPMASTHDNNNTDQALSLEPPNLEKEAPKRIIYAMDPSNMEFDELLEIAQARPLRTALVRVKILVENDANYEDEFHDFSASIQEILMRLVKDVNVLNTPNISRHALYTSKIIEMVKTNIEQQYFSLESFFREVPDKSRGCHLERKRKKVLVIRKVYFPDDMPEANNKQSLPEGSSTTSTQPNSPASSRSEPVASIKTQRSSLAALSSNELITDCLNYILKFIKDDTQLNLEFSGLESKKARFLYILFSSIIASNYANGLGGKSFCTALWEAVEIFSLKYQFRIRYNVYDSGVTESLVLDKIPKMTKTAHTDAVNIHWRPKKMVIKYKEFISKLSSEFIKDSLNRFVKFLGGPLEASITFVTMEALEKKFLKDIVNISRSDPIKSIFDEDTILVLNRIKYLVDSKVGYRLKMKDKKKHDGEIEVTYYKMPDFSKPASRHQSRSRPKKPNLNFKPGGTLNPTKANGSGSVVQGVPDHEPGSAMDRYLSDSDMESENSSKDYKYRSRKAQRPTRAALRNEQLLEALSVPVKSDKAMKMMVGMGWEGGALGSRGDGITEPLMPNLLPIAGAGLGHGITQTTSLPKKTPTTSTQCLPTTSSPRQRVSMPSSLSLPTFSTPTVPGSRYSQEKFRHLLLRHLLELLVTKSKYKLLQLYPSLTKKGKAFLRQTMKTFNARKKLKVENVDRATCDKIKEQFEQDPLLYVATCISDDMQRVVLSRLHSVTKIKFSSRDSKFAIDLILAENAQLLMENCDSPESRHSFEPTRFRVNFLIKLLEFVKNDSRNDMQMIFDTALTNTQMQFIRTSIRHADKNLQTAGAAPELALHQEVRRNMGTKFRMNLEFGEDNRSFIATKDYDATKAPTEVGKRRPVPGKSNVDQITDNSEHLLKENETIIDARAENSEVTNTNAIEKVFAETDDQICAKDAISDDKHIGINIMINNDDAMTESGNITVKDIDRSINKSNNNENEGVVPKNFNIPKDSETEDKESNDNDTDSIIDMCISDPNGGTPVDDSETDISMADAKISDEGSKLSDNNVESIDPTGNLDIRNKSAVKPQSVDDNNIKIVFLRKRYMLPSDMAKYIQGLISLNITQTFNKDLPLLQCHGVQNDALVYSCHNKKSYDCLLKICIGNNISIVTKEFFKMSLKINSFFDYDDEYIFNMLELYNNDISTKEWGILKKEVLEDCVIYEVKMDIKSFNFIMESNLSLYAGVDKVTFSIIWE